MKRVFNLEIAPTVEELAAAFCTLDSDQMATFFDMVGELSDAWKSSLCQQMAYAMHSENWTDRARYTASVIGQYGTRSDN